MGVLGLEGNPRGAYVVNFSIAVAIIDTLAVALRLVARHRSKAAFAADDWWIVGSLIPLYCMLAAGITLTVVGGLGRSITELSLTQLSTFLKITMCSMLTYSLTLTSVKISLLILYRRIFDTAAFRKKSLVVGIACIVWWVVEVFMEVFQCHPFAAAFDPTSLFTDRCIDIQSFYIGITASNIGLDVILFLLPLHMVWKLKLSAKQKIALSGIFSIGLLACIAGAMRIRFVLNLKEVDITGSSAEGYLWSQIEPATAILCACLVTYRPLFANISFSLPSRLTSFLNFKRGSSSGSDVEDDNTYERRLQYQSPTAHGLHTPTTYQDVHAKVTKNGVHIIEVGHGRLGSMATYKAGNPEILRTAKANAGTV